MRSVWLLGVAACWSPKPAEPPAARATTTVAEPTTAPVAPKPKAYELPASVSDALAKEKLAGNVLVPADALLYASATAARKDSQDSQGRAIAMRVVADRGDVVEVSTGAAQDCVGDWSQPYDLRVFVAREKLIPRVKAGIVKTFSDGTAVAIDRGAPVDLSEQGLRWGVSDLDAGIAPAAEQLVLAVPPSGAPSALPPPPGERLVCENDQVMTRAERVDARRRDREARAKEREARREAQLEELRARLAREAAERERKAKAEAAKKPPPPATKGPKKIKDLVQPMKIEKQEVLISDRDLGFGDDSDLWGDDYRWTDDRYQPWCGIGEPYDKPKPPAPTLDGRAVPWPYDDDAVVTRGAKGYFADVQHTCARVRMAVTREGVRSTGAGGAIGGIGGGQQVKVWVPSPGKVTWRDGSPAGTYAGGKKYREVVEEANRICVQVEDVAELVCHDKSTAKTEMVSPWGY